MDISVVFSSNEEYFNVPQKFTKEYLDEILKRFDLDNPNVELIDIYNGERVMPGDDLLSTHYELKLNKKGKALKELRDMGISHKSDYPRKPNSELIKLLVESGVSPNYTDGTGVNFLQRAIEYGDVDLIDFLYNREEKIKHGEIPPLHYASTFDNTDVVLALINNGEDVNFKEWGDNSPLNVAAKYKRLDNAKVLLNRGADINSKNNFEDNPISLAVSNNDISMVKEFIKRGADLNPGFSILNNYIINGENHDTEIIKLLIDNGLDVNERFNYCGNDFNALYVSLIYCQLHIVRFLCENGMSKEEIRHTESFYYNFTLDDEGVKIIREYI